MKFDEKLHRSLLREKLVKEDRRPSTGIWYLIYLKPNWFLRCFKDTEYPDVDHKTVWEHYLSKELADHYKINSDDIDMLYYAFPRGRVVYQSKGGRHIQLSSDVISGKWVIYHGDDAPGGIDQWKKKIVSDFNLAPFVGNWSTEDDHENMLKTDIKAMSKIIGRYL